MDITKIWMAQRKLRRKAQIPGMVEALKRGETLPPINLIESEDGEIQMLNGHHRLVAIWLSGRRSLEKHEYTLLQQEGQRPRMGKIDRLLPLVQKLRVAL